MIHKSKSEPPQFGYIYLGRGWYLSTDPIGWILSTTAHTIHRLKERLLGTDNRYYQNRAHWWDGVYRVRWRIVYKIMEWEKRRWEKEIDG